ncbi:hypothetical protein OTU49_006581 [Cherax quadricarinatus]|uniref:Uncharacterized protein n=1 Tax=Cherax quadricarinatus TaxID=27406 RepID=A0AAW0WMX1_CHEQU
MDIFQTPKSQFVATWASTSVYLHIYCLYYSSGLYSVHLFNINNGIILFNGGRILFVRRNVSISRDAGVKSYNGQLREAVAHLTEAFHRLTGSLYLTLGVQALRYATADMEFINSRR